MKTSVFEAANPLTFKGAFTGSWKGTRLGLYLIGALFFFFYILYPAFPTMDGRTLAGWTWYGCNSINGFLHGRFIPIVFCVLIYLAAKKVKDYEISSNVWGLVGVVFGILLYLAAVRTLQPRLASIGAPFAFAGMAYYLFGHKIAQNFIFPAFFLWFAIPIPGLETLMTAKLQFFITEFCYKAGSLLGWIW